MSEFQNAIRSELTNGHKRYVFLCNGCGCEVNIYSNKRIRGHVWCPACYKNRSRVYVENHYNSKVAKIKRILLEGEPTDIGREITIDRIKEVLF